MSAAVSPHSLVRDLQRARPDRMPACVLLFLLLLAGLPARAGESREGGPIEPPAEENRSAEIRRSLYRADESMPARPPRQKMSPEERRALRDAVRGAYRDEHRARKGRD